jgi:predicted adenylyl cyclase CyaB
MQNIEFKAELRDVEAARRQCAVLGARRLGILKQTDTYYKLTDGRLKRRQAPGEPTEWVFYHRLDRARPKMCNYSILTDEQARRQWGSQSLREWLKVIKMRELWMLDRLRIHLDDVLDLGWFFELEAVVSRDFDVKQAHAEIDRLRQAFWPMLGEAIGTSYSDLMAQVIAEKTEARGG